MGRFYGRVREPLKWGMMCPFPWGDLCPHLTHVAWAEAYLVPSGILIYPTVWLQYTNVAERTDRQDNGPMVRPKID